jgi:hypothetical protein
MKNNQEKEQNMSKDNADSLAVPEMTEIRSLSRSSTNVLAVNNLRDKVQILIGEKPGGNYTAGIFINRAELLEALGAGTGKEIGEDEIRKGDRIRVHTTSGGWRNITVEGVAARRSSSGAWSTEDWGALTYSENAGKHRIYLLDRPVPKLPTEPGSVIIATKVRGAVGEWVALYDAGGAYWTTQGVAGGNTVHQAEQITEWRPAMIVEVQ